MVYLALVVRSIESYLDVVRWRVNIQLKANTGREFLLKVVIISARNRRLRNVTRQSARLVNCRVGQPQGVAHIRGRIPNISLP
jgi:hypothetical protein